MLEINLNKFFELQTNALQKQLKFTNYYTFSNNRKKNNFHVIG